MPEVSTADSTEAENDVGLITLSSIPFQHSKQKWYPLVHVLYVKTRTTSRQRQQWGPQVKWKHSKAVEAMQNLERRRRRLVPWARYDSIDSSVSAITWLDWWTPSLCNSSSSSSSNSSSLSSSSSSTFWLPKSGSSYVAGTSFEVFLRTCTWSQLVGVVRLKLWHESCLLPINFL